MKFGPFSIPKNLDEVYALIRNLTAGLGKLTFLENFDCFQATGVVIGAGAEVLVRNEFRDGTIPTRWLIVDATGGNQITRGPTAWNINYLSLKNNGAAQATVSVVFFR